MGIEDRMSLPEAISHIEAMVDELWQIAEEADEGTEADRKIIAKCEMKIAALRRVLHFVQKKNS